MKHLKQYENFAEKFKFWLQDSADNCYWFYLKVKNSTDFMDAIDTKEFDDFLDKMETSNKPWGGTLDATGLGMSWMFRSDEIQDFETAIKMWFSFFEKMNLTENKIYISKIGFGLLDEPNESNLNIIELIKVGESFGWSKEEIEKFKFELDAKKYNL